MTQFISDFSPIVETAQLPDRDSRRYLAYSEENAGMAQFNTMQPVMTKRVTISGLKLQIEEGNKENNLFELLHETKTIRELIICADELVIASSLHLPGTNITIRARVLHLKDSNRKTTSIKTIPEAIDFESASERGIQGQRGGNITLWVRDFKYSRGAAKRFITQGGKGQTAKPGERGAPGDSLPVWSGAFTQIPHWPLKEETVYFKNTFLKKGHWHSAVFAEIYQGPPYKDKWTLVSSFRKRQWPGDGKPAIKPGIPGAGGDGGDLLIRKSRDGYGLGHFENALKSRVSLDTGPAGDKAKDVPQSLPGEPVHACWANAKLRRWGYIPTHIKKRPGDSNFMRLFRVEGRAFHTSRPGAGAKAPGLPKKDQGKAGKFDVREIRENDWIHEHILRAVNLRIRDAFLANQKEEALELVDIYLRYLDNGPDPSQVTHTERLLRNELQTWSHRLRGPFDFFGNPAGWVPMLSFESNFRLYKQEVESAIPIIYLHHCIREQQNSAEQARELVARSLNQLNQESQNALDAYKAAQVEMASAHDDYKTIVRDIGKQQKKLKALEADEKRRAEALAHADKHWRTVIKVLGGILQVVPVGQPALGALGQTATVFSELDYTKETAALDATSKMVDVFADLDTTKYRKGAKKLFDSMKAAEKVRPGDDDLSELDIDFESSSEYSDSADHEGLYFFDEIDLNDSEEDSQTEKPSADTSSKEDKDSFDSTLKKKAIERKVKTALDAQEKGWKQISSAIANSAVSESDVDTQLERIRTLDTSFAQVVEGIEGLNQRKTQYYNRLTHLLSIMESSAATVLNNQMGAIALRAEMRSTLNRISHGALEYSRELSERAFHRLLQYQYYVAKSYNYLMLEAYSPNYDIEGMFEEFRELLDSSTTGRLKQQDFKLMSSVFNAHMREIVVRIIERYMKNRPRTDGSLWLDLDPVQLKALNETGEVTISLRDMGFLDLTHEDIRISDIRTRRVTVSNPVTRGSANVNLVYQHAGVSQLRRHGQLYRFRSGSYNGEDETENFSENRPSWGATVHLDREGQEIQEHSPDPVEQSLIKHLIRDKDDDSGAEHLRRFRPSAWADITIIKTATPIGYEPELEELQLEMSYVYHRVSSQLSTIDVFVPGRLQPVIQCNEIDVNGRRHGRGSFLRTFDRGRISEVLLTAPAKFGVLKFRGWYQPSFNNTKKEPLCALPQCIPDASDLPEEYGKLITQERKISRKTNAHHRLIAVYA